MGDLGEEPIVRVNVDGKRDIRTNGRGIMGLRRSIRMQLSNWPRILMEVEDEHGLMS